MVDTSRESVVVVGAGLTGAHVVTTLREEGHRGRVTLLGAEPEPPYERPPLSKSFLQGASPFSDALVHPAEWYAEHDVELRLGTEVTAIDREAHEVELAGGERFGYGRLVLATGAGSRTLDVPGAELAGIHTLRSAAESRALREVLGEGVRLVVVGGGWIGLEVAASARGLGAEVTVLETAPLPLGNVLGERVAEQFAALHRRHGVDLRTGITVRGFVGAGGRVTGVETDLGEFGADVVLVAIGAVPRTGLAAAAGLTVRHGGVVVDEFLRTSDAHVLAAGDIALAHNTLLGTELRVEHWDNAIRQGQLAARTILATGATYDWLPYFFTDQFELGMEYVGRSGPDDDVVLRRAGDDGELIVFWLGEGGRVTAAMNVDVWDVNEELRGVVGRVVDPSRLEDPAVPLAALGA